MFKKIILKTIKLLLFIIIFLVIGGFSGVFANRFIMPWLSSFDQLARYKFFEKANQEVTVINRTEQITVKEDYSIQSTAESIFPLIVNVVVIPKEKNLDGSTSLNKTIKNGLIITSDGLISATWDDFMAINNDKEYLNEKFDYKIITQEGKEFEAKIQAVDDYLQLVFYKAEANNLPALIFSDLGEVKAGEKVIICGKNSGNHQNFLSQGIINEKDKNFSLLNSNLSFSDKMEGIILTDAEINYKNRGGPVINYQGKIIGLANQIEKDGKEIGFIIPFDKFKKSVDQVINTGDIKRPVLGAYYLPLSRELALLNNLPLNQGALVYSSSGQQGLAVIKNSPADLAGLKIGDIIMRVGEEEINADNPLSQIISNKQPGEKINFFIYRKGEKIEVETVLK